MSERDIAISDPRERAIQDALALISDGWSVRRACEEVGIGKYMFLKNVDGNQYARARDACADSHFDDLTELANGVVQGRVESGAGRTAADIIKWRLARMRPKIYGDKVAIAGDAENPLTVNHGITPAAQAIIDRIMEKSTQ